MDQDIPERDYLLIVCDLSSQLLINFCKLAKRFANYLELPLNSGLQQCIIEVIAECFSGYELRNQIRRLPYIEELFARVTRHTRPRACG